MSTLLRNPPSAEKYSYTAAMLARYLQVWLQEESPPPPNTPTNWYNWGKSFFEEALGGIGTRQQTEPRFARIESSYTVLCIVLALEPKHGAEHTFAPIEAYLREGRACLDDLLNAKERTPDLVEKVRIYHNFFQRLYEQGSSDRYSEYMRRSHDPDDDE